ncbi:helix-turn-helix transcriptional regulator [Rhodobacteraceae bacterium F11138]|nr:helix-turn-helix transcriptional regulator [Rhodobacteraceae bacterium F11138]
MWDTTAKAFAAMGSEARLRVLKALVRAGETGLTVGEIQERTGIAPSTLAHHLKYLSAGGVIVQQKTGRSVINRADYGQLRILADFILDECCADAPQQAVSNG